MTTPAHVNALKQVQVNDWGRRRDFFTALLISLKLKDVPTDDILASYYPKPKSVTVTRDPDIYGAECDTAAIRVGLKAPMRM